MSSLNRFTGIGNLGADPELRYTQNQKPVCSFTVAMSEKDRDGNEHTEWIKVNCWDKLAESCSKYLAKGRKVYFEGRIGTRKWTDKSGVERYSTEVTAGHVIFLSPKGSNQKSDEADPSMAPPPPF